MIQNRLIWDLDRSMFDETFWIKSTLLEVCFRNYGVKPTGGTGVRARTYFFGPIYCMWSFTLVTQSYRVSYWRRLSYTHVRFYVVESQSTGNCTTNTPNSFSLYLFFYIFNMLYFQEVALKRRWFAKVENKQEVKVIWQIAPHGGPFPG